jgi:DNA mismatch repair protein MutL
MESGTPDEPVTKREFAPEPSWKGLWPQTALPATSWKTPPAPLASEGAAPAPAIEPSPPVDRELSSVEAGEDSPNQLPAESQGEARPLLRVPLRLLGVINRLYVVLESDRGVVLMDQHAAHERVLFEQMMTRMETGNAPSQRLLLPDTVEVSFRDAIFIRDHLEVLTRLGVGLSEFGERTFLLDALPPFVKVKDAKQFVRDLVDALITAGREVNKMRLGEDVVAKTVCRHAIKANDPLAPAELERLIEDLRCCSMPYTCPHGRPTLIEISHKELERKFGRVV